MDIYILVSHTKQTIKLQTPKAKKLFLLQKDVCVHIPVHTCTHRKAFPIYVICLGYHSIALLAFPRCCKLWNIDYAKYKAQHTLYAYRD